MIKPLCSRCGAELEEGGGLLFSPPDSHSSRVDKYHICVPCWPHVIVDVLTYFTAEVQEARTMEMTIAEARKAKGLLSAQIAEALHAFTEQIGLMVSRVDVRAIDVSTFADGRRRSEYRVELDVDLP